MSLTPVPVPYNKNLAPLPQKIQHKYNLINYHPFIGLQCLSSWFPQLPFIEGFRNIPQPAQALLLNWSLLISSTEPAFLEGIPVDSELNPPQLLWAICFPLKLILSPKFGTLFSQISMLLIEIIYFILHASSNNPILPGLPVLKCSELKLLSLQPPRKGFMLFPPYKKQFSVGQKLPNFLLWGFSALKPFPLPSLQLGWLKKSQK